MTAKTWYANNVFLPMWRPIIQLVNVVLLGKQKLLEWKKLPLRVQRSLPKFMCLHLLPAQTECRTQSGSSPNRVHVSSPSSPERVLPSSSSSLERRQLSPDPTDIPSSSSPGRRKQASPTSPDLQHSHESMPWAHSILSDHATRSGSPISPDREETVPSNNEPLGFGSPMVPYPPDDDDEEVTAAGLTSLGASDPLTTSKGKRLVEHKSLS
ncbi:hypothetical protein R1sor_017268 [Riccia sorocarpa]|uniref:Uncharacterized protein n=1 Tax=Riccia sorocarpa TaxID=122646 RepID=A0ABD3I6Q8_9MARC